MDRSAILTVVRSCTKNKAFNDFNLLITMINYLKDDKIVLDNVTLSIDTEKK